MPWLFFFAALTLLGVFGTVVNVNRVRFERLAARETSGLTAVATMPGPYTQAAELPTPVARYRQLAVGNRLPVATLRLRHGGTFALSPTSKPLPIEGTQLSRVGSAPAR